MRLTFLWLSVAVLVVLVVTTRPAYAETDAAREVARGLAARAGADEQAARAAFERAAASTDDSSAAAEALYLLGEMDEQSFAYARAVERYAASFARSASSRYAPRALTRADFLRAHAEGAFAPLVRLEHVRQDPSVANDAASIDSLASDLEAFPSGPVRVEARMLVAEAYLGRMARRQDGMRELRSVLDDPKTDPLTARVAARQLVESMLAESDVDGAARESRRLQNRLDPAYVTSVGRLVRRRMLRVFAYADLGLVAVLVATALALAKRRARLAAVRDALRGSVPLVIAFGAYVAIAGGVLASRYEAGNAKPFLLFGAALVPLLIAARAWGAAGSSATAARAARGVLCASCAFAAAFVMLEVIDPAYLESFGL